ncbi:MAG: hypothetical protein HAW62_01890 [Endozoicomonadaceae bacterium]|nr:hypothetical protein [Endozoicomonadaceae bacterium]
MSKHTKKGMDSLSEEDKILFTEAMENVKPLDKSKHQKNIQRKALPQKTQSNPVSKQRESGRQHHIADTHELSDICFQLIEPEAYLTFQHNSLSHTLFNQLKAEDFLIDAEFDLHGCTVDQAMHQLWQFMHHSYEKKYKCVRVIHGKSRQRFQDQVVTLKSLLVVWLTRFPFILGYCSCKPKSGGTGAVNVLLQRK